MRAKREQRVDPRRVKVKVKAGAAEHVTAVASGKAKVQNGSRRGALKAPLRRVTKQIVAKDVDILKLRPKGTKANRRIRKALKRDQKVKAKIKVRLTDELDNSVTKRRAVRLVARGG